MAAFYADENFPLETVEALRRLGHDVLTALEAGQANQSIPDDAVLVFATSARRILLTLNRRHFIGLHAKSTAHAGIVVCTEDPDFARLAASIDAAVQSLPSQMGTLIRINRPAR